MADSEESKKVLIMLSSPRKKGNSAALAEEIAAGAESKGAAVESLFLHGMKIAPCQSCYACQKKGSKGCAIDDDMQAIYPKLIEADAWVIASPVFWFTMSAQAKLFMDRCFALPCYGADRLFGKTNRHRHELRGYGSLCLRLRECASHVSGHVPVCGVGYRGHGLWKRHGGRGDQVQ